MWDDFSSPGDENREPRNGNGVYEALLLGGSHSGNIIASKPCRRPVRPSHLFKNSPKKSTTSVADEPSLSKHSSLRSSFTNQRSPLKTLNANKISGDNLMQSSNPDNFLHSPLRSPPTSPPGKPVQRVSSILAQRQKFDLTGLNGSILDMERLVTTPKKTPKVLDSKAVRIKINSSKVSSGASPVSKRRSSENVSNKVGRYCSNGVENSFHSPTETTSSVPGARNTGFSTSELIEQEGEKQDKKYHTSREKNLTSTLTPSPTVGNDNYYNSSGGVSLSRPSVQRSHSRNPSSNNSSNSKDSKIKKSPEKKTTPLKKFLSAPRKLETELRPSPLKRKEALPYQNERSTNEIKILTAPKVSFSGIFDYSNLTS